MNHTDDTMSVLQILLSWVTSYGRGNRGRLLSWRNYLQAKTARYVPVKCVCQMLLSLTNTDNPLVRICFFDLLSEKKTLSLWWGVKKCCHTSSSLPSSVFEKRRCLNARMTVLRVIPPEHGWKGRSWARGMGAHPAQKTREVSRENDYTGDSGQQRQRGEAERGRRGAREDKWPRER